jgi:hypothetical protein
MARFVSRFAVLLLLALVARGGHAFQPTPDFTGRWKLDAQKSDDTELSILAGLGDPDRMRPENRQTAERLIALARALDRIEIRQSAKDFRTYDDADNVRIYYIDGKKHARETPWGERLQTVTRWEGNELFMETDGKDLGEVSETYGMEGRQMVFIVRIRLKGQKDDIVVKNYYDRVTE